MTGQGFGFTPDDDDDRDKGDDKGGQGGSGGSGGQNPFGDFGFFGFPLGGFGMPGQPGQGGQGGQGGAGGPGGPGGLGDFLNQLGEMMSGMGQQMDAAGGAPVDHSVTERIARQRIGQVAPVRDSEREALSDALRLAELWLDEATTLPAGANRAEGWNSLQWLEHTLPTWKRIVDPVAEQMAEASVAGMPEQAREMMGPMLGMMSRMNSMNFGVQLGGALADLAKDALTASDLGLPLHTTGAAALLPTHLTAMAGAARRFAQLSSGESWWDQMSADRLRRRLSELAYPATLIYARRVEGHAQAAFELHRAAEAARQAEELRAMASQVLDVPMDRTLEMSGCADRRLELLCLLFDYSRKGDEKGGK